MPQQLIYTSAPRLLTAGRSGFGTVAKSPALRDALLPLAHSTVSGHLRVLRDAGLVALCDGERSYCLEPAALDWLARFSRDMTAQPVELEAAVGA